MTTFNTAYETSACAGFVTQKITAGIKQAAVSSEVRKLENMPILLVEGAGTYGESVPPFSHPFAFPYAYWGEQERPHIAIDMRHYGRFDRNRNEFVIGQNKVEYNMALARAKLNWVWIDRDKEILRDLSQMPMAVYASWLSENIARRYALEPAEQFNLSILAGIFYSSLFHDEEKLEERDKLRIVNAISRNLRCKAEDVIKIIDQVDVIPNVGAFCTKAAEIVSPVRLSQLNAPVLVTILGSTWSGTNHRELLGVAIEHPPTWIAILMAASSERYYHNSQLARICERFTKNDMGKNFMHSALRMLDIVSQ